MIVTIAKWLHRIRGGWSFSSIYVVNEAPNVIGNGKVAIWEMV